MEVCNSIPPRNRAMFALSLCRAIVAALKRFGILVGYVAFAVALGMILLSPWIDWKIMYRNCRMFACYRATGSSFGCDAAP